MDGNFSEMVQSVMSDPEAMSKLMEVAKGLMPETQSVIAEDRAKNDPPKIEQGSVGLISKIKSGNDERIALISALRPFLSE